MADDESIGLLGEYLDDQRRDGGQTIITRASYLTIMRDMPNIKCIVVDLKACISPNHDHIVAARAFRIAQSNSFMLVVLSRLGSVILHSCNCEGKVTLNHISSKEYVFDQDDCHRFGNGLVIISNTKLMVISLHN
jgi:hypothetical protein